MVTDTIKKTVQQVDISVKDSIASKDCWEKTVISQLIQIKIVMCPNYKVPYVPGMGI